MRNGGGIGRAGREEGRKGQGGEERRGRERRGEKAGCWEGAEGLSLRTRTLEHTSGQKARGSRRGAYSASLSPGPPPSGSPASLSVLSQPLQPACLLPLLNVRVPQGTVLRLPHTLHSSPKGSRLVTRLDASDTPKRSTGPTSHDSGLINPAVCRHLHLSV